MGTEKIGLSSKISTVTPIGGRADGTAKRVEGNVIYITRMPRKIENILSAIALVNTGGELDRIFSLFTDEEKDSLQEYIERHPDRGFGNEVQDLLSKLTLGSSGKMFLKTIGGEVLYRDSVILRIIIWLGLNGDVLSNYLQSAEETELHELVRLSKTFSKENFKHVYDTYFSGLPLEGIFTLWSQVCNGTYTSSNFSSDTQSAHPPR